MFNIPTISSLLTVSTLAANGRSQLTVGIKLSDGQRFWADCFAVPAASRSGEAAVFDPTQAANHVKNLVQPLWLGQSASDFRPLAQMLLPLMEPFSYTRTIPPQAATGAVTRRSLITGFLAEEISPEANVEKVTIERLLHPALQYGLTAALLRAVAAVNREPVAAVVAREYGLALAETAVPLQIALDDVTLQTARTILTTHVASLGYTTSTNKHKETLGANGERLQQHIRQVAAWLPTVDASFQPTLLLNLQHSFRELFNNDEGKVLGALVGLEQAAKPFTLLIQNPVWQNSHEAQLKSLQKLKEYVTFRRLKLKLVADAWIDSSAAVTEANAAVAHLVHIDLPRLGNLEAGMTAVLHTLANNQQIILSGEDTALTTHIALATRPSCLSGSPLVHYNEMQIFLQK